MAELAAVRDVLMDASNRKASYVELRLDVKAMVSWLQGTIPPINEVYWP